MADRHGGSRFPRNFRGSTRRQTAWGVGTGGTGQTALTSNVASIVGATVVPVIEGLTCVRICGFWSIWLTTVTAANDGFQGAFGIGIATLAAVTAGIGSLPTPITESTDENWLYHKFFSCNGPAAGQLDSMATILQFEIDSKAMRKFPVGMAMYAAVDVVEIGTAVGVVTHDSRSLSKLP